MRRDDHPYWFALRRFLNDHGVDPNRTIVADDNAFGALTGGFVVALDSRVYQYTYDWAGQPLGSGIFTDWRDATTSWPGLTADSQGILHRDLIKLALELQEEGKQE